MIIWAPHWSVYYKGYRSFGNFHVYYKYFINLAKRHKDLHLVIRPHFRTFLEAVMQQVVSQKDLLSFTKECHDLSNVTLSADGDYVKYFLESDAMITDGVSFLTEYPVLKKPLLHTVNKEQTKFNDFGEKVISFFPKAYTEEDIDVFVNEIISKKTATVSEDKYDFLNKLIMPDDKLPSKIIIDSMMKAY